MAIFSYITCIQRSRRGVTSSEFCKTAYYWKNYSRMIGLQYVEETWNVTDGRTDRIADAR